MTSDVWQIDGTRQYYCKTCRRFTDWEFIHPTDAEHDRCSVCKTP